MSKLLITTRADEGVRHFSGISHPIFKEYANRVGADFQVLSHLSSCTVGDGKWHFRILKHYDLFEEYDRILHLDTDMLLKPDCPNLFEVVPEDTIGTIYEDVGSRQSHRRNLMTKAQYKFGNVGWFRGYINTGTFMTSKIHKDIFQLIDNQYWTGFGFDDVHLGYLIKKYGFKVTELPYQYNHMAMYSEPWNNNADRFQSHILHYAGRGVFDHGVSNKIEQMKLDHKRLYK